MKYLDANCMIGPHYEPRYGEIFDKNKILEKMDFYNIDEAVVYHGMAREYDFHKGNMLVLKETSDEKRLHPCWVLGLHYTGKLPHPNIYIPKALSYGVKLFRLFFGSFISETLHIDITAYLELFKVLEEYNCPVIVEFESSFKLNPSELIQIDNMLKEYPKLNIILSSLCFDRLILQLIPRLNIYPNLYLLSSGIHSQNTIKKLVNAGYADRIIYGSCFPWFSAGVTKISLAYEDILKSDCKKIASTNLYRLMKDVKYSG